MSSVVPPVTPHEPDPDTGSSPPSRVAFARPGLDAAPTPRPGRRKFGSTADMVRSLALVFAFVLAVLALDPRPEGNGLRTVDWSQSVPQAVAAANYPIAVPVGLEPGWRTTSARVTQTPDGSAAWHIGFVTPQEEYAGVEQSDGDVDAFVKDMTRQARRVIYDGAGGNWVSLQRTIGAETRRSLVLWPEPGGTYGKSVVIVTGTASWDELRQLAEAVRPR